MGERHERRIIIGEPHAHMRESMESLSALSFSLLRRVFFVGFVSPSASSLIQSFSVVLDLRHLLRIVLLTQYILIIPSRSHEKTVGEPHEHGRIASVWENHRCI